MEPRAAAAPAAGATAASIESLAARMQPVVESLRGLRFLHPVPVRVVSDSVAREHFAARMARFYPEDELRIEGRVYEHLGLVGPGTDLAILLLDVLDEQAGGYYDPESGMFYVLGDVPASLLGVILAHELTHALDDQHFDIDSTFAALSHDDDRQAAFGAVVEGSGTLVMSLYLVQAMARGELDANALVELQASEFGKAEKLEAAPEVVRRALIAPYVLGQMFLSGEDAEVLTAGVDSAAFDRAFRDPPASTEQILHPEKYWRAAEPDAPRPLPQADFGPVLGGGWRQSGEGRLGEILIALLTGPDELSLDDASLATAGAWTNAGAQGWGNDRWEHWTDGEHFATVLLTLWDTPEDASEFVSSLRIPHVQVARRDDVVVVVAGEVPRTDGRIARECLDLVRRK